MMKKILSILLCIAIAVSLIPLKEARIVNSAEVTEESKPGFSNYGKHIGDTAYFNIDAYINFFVFSDPTAFVYDEHWYDDNYWVYYCEADGIYDIELDHLFVIEDYYWDENSLDLWYKVDAAPGYELPPKMQNARWVLQNNTEKYEYEDWEEFSPDSLIIQSPKNITTDKDGNVISSVNMGAYDEVEINCESTLQGKVEYQWQIFVNDEWVNILGQNDSSMSLTAGILINALDRKDYSANVRCVTKSGSKTSEGSAVSVVVEPYEAVGTDTFTVPDGYAPALLAESEEDYRYVTVNYIFENGSEAANPFVAKVLTGGELNVTVSFPTVQGYLPYYENNREDSLTVNGVITENVTYTVYYLPTEVEYRVDVYFQNVNDDGYTFQSTETLMGLTGSKVPHTTVSYEGMYELLHETPTIAANGSTRVEVYYNRVYYLTHFELDGGYGVYSIYARYGSDLAGTIGTPIKPGFSFLGWDDISSGSGDGFADVIPATVPAKEQSFKALWKESEVAKVRIAYWGENPNDEGYSYIKSQELYAKPGTELTFGAGVLVCALDEHTHSGTCKYICESEEHTHSDDCYNPHTPACYPGAGDNKVDDPRGAPRNPVNGQIYSVWYYRYYKYISIEGSWYEYNGSEDNGDIIPPVCTDCLVCELEEHTHTAACYACVEHNHTADCYLNTDSMDSALWTLVKSDKVTVASDGSTVMNVYYDRTSFTMTFKETGNNGKTLATITDKWGADIRSRFENISKANTFLWSEEVNGDSPWTSFLDVMPKENRTYYANITTSGTIQTATYYGADLNGDYTIILYTASVKYRGNLTVSKEEFVEIEGYVFNEDKSTGTGSNYNGAKFYYDRASTTLEFYSESELKRTESVKYEQSLAGFADYVPDFPDIFEEGSHEFAGWYLNPECTGERVDLSAVKMPAENMALYAKWDKVYHNVNIYKEKFDDGTFGDPVLADGKQPDPVMHGNVVFESDFTVPIPENKPYTFIGWFYMDGTQERMWDFKSNVVIKDTDIYAKWSAEVLVPYTVRFIFKDENGTEIEIADTISNSSLGGTTVTFEAKAGGELYPYYRSGYFPITTSHSLTMDVDKAETGMTYDFIYIKKDDVPYTVRYVDSEGKKLKDDKVVSTNSYAVVTEKFEYIEGYSPDKYQKTLVLDGDTPENNVIVFVYSKDDTQSVYNVTHYIQSSDGESYIEHSDYGDIGKIGDILKITPLVLTGFTYDHALVNNVKTGLTDGTVNGTITKEGLEIKLYYKRNQYPYKVQYLDEDTSEVLKEPTIITPGAFYGSVVTESNPPEIDNYQLSSVSSSIINVDDADPTKNIITVYYKEKTVVIHYEVVGPTGSGTVSPEKTEVKVISGTGASSTATANEGYVFEGWYYDSGCTQKVTGGNTLYLTKPDDNVWKTATYYAKFGVAEADLTIKRTDAADSTQVYIYEIKNNETNEIIYVSIVGNGETTIHKLTLGEYTITQHNDWSWRHDDAAEVIEHQSQDGTTVEFSKEATIEQWINGNSELIKNQRG